MAERVEKADLDRALRERDLVFLSDQVANEELDAETRSHLARIIRGLFTGETRFPKHRPRTSHSKKNTWKIALRVVELRRDGGWSKKNAAVKKVAEEFNCSDTKVWGCLRQFRKVLREIDDQYEPYDHWQEERHREEGREEERREEERQEEERREEEWREQLNAAEAYLFETEGDRDFTDKEIEDAAVLLEVQRRSYK
jgi:hypothetical protein